MAFDAALADRTRDLVADRAGGARDRPMFGGLGLVVPSGHMPVCVAGRGGLLVRVSAGSFAELVALDGVEPMRMGSRSARTWVHVNVGLVETDEQLAAWVQRGLDVVATLPPKTVD